MYLRMALSAWAQWDFECASTDVRVLQVRGGARGLWHWEAAAGQRDAAPATIRIDSHGHSGCLFLSRSTIIEPRYLLRQWRPQLAPANGNCMLCDCAECLVPESAC